MLVGVTEQVRWKERRMSPPAVLEMEQMPVIEESQMGLWEWIPKRARGDLCREDSDLHWVICFPVRVT